MKNTSKPPKISKAKVLENIAHQILKLDTLEERKSDRLDFHEFAVWQVKEALEAAFEAGKNSNGKG